MRRDEVEEGRAPAAAAPPGGRDDVLSAAATPPGGGDDVCDTGAGPTGGGEGSAESI